MRLRNEIRKFNCKSIYIYIYTHTILSKHAHTYTYIYLLNRRQFQIIYRLPYEYFISNMYIYIYYTNRERATFNILYKPFKAASVLCALKIVNQPIRCAVIPSSFYTHTDGSILTVTYYTTFSPAPRRAHKNDHRPPAHTDIETI